MLRLDINFQAVKLRIMVTVFSEYSDTAGRMTNLTTSSNSRNKKVNTNQRNVW